MKRQKGFTLVELMIVVVILGILAAIAIPAFIKYIRASKTSEAKENLAYLFRESSTYFAQERVERGMGAADIPAQFPMTTAMHPAAIPAGTKVTTHDWDTQANAGGSFTWQALKFGIADPHYYAYTYTSSGTGTSAQFTAAANGNLDGDANISTFERAGQSNAQLEVEGSRGLFEADPLE